MRMYQDEMGRLVTIGELWDEFEELKQVAPDEYNYEFDQYVENCTGKDGTLTEVTVDTFGYETLWANVAKSLTRFLKAFGIKFKVSGISNMIWHFDITATDRQKAEVVSFLQEIAA